MMQALQHRKEEAIEVDKETREALAEFYRAQNERHEKLASRVNAVESMQNILGSDVEDIKEKQKEHKDLIDGIVKEQMTIRIDQVKQYGDLKEHKDLIDGIVKEQMTIRIDQVKQYGDLKERVIQTYHAAEDSIPKWFAEQQAQKEATSSKNALWIAAAGAVVGAIIAGIALWIGHV